MDRIVLEEQRNKIIDAINTLTEKLKNTQDDTIEQEDLLEQFCFLESLLPVEPNPKLLSNITLERLIKCIKYLKPILQFRCSFNKDGSDAIITTKHNRLEINHSPEYGGIVVHFNNFEQMTTFYGFKQFIYFIDEECGYAAANARQLYEDFVINFK